MGILSSVGTGFRKVFGTRNDRIVKKYQQVALEAGRFENELRGDYDARFTEAQTALDLEP